jgi:hypothetical protein
MIESFGVSVQLLGEAPIQDRHRYIQSVARVISSVGAKIVHGHGAQPEWIAAAAKQSGRPCIITHHHTEGPRTLGHQPDPVQLLSDPTVPQKRQIRRHISFHN